MEALDKVIDKIRKLMALSESARKIGSVHEAEKAAKLAQKLIIDYNVDMAKLGKKGTQAMKEIILPYDQDKREGNWLRILWSNIAKYNFCYKIHINEGKDMSEANFILIGQPHNLELVKFFAEQCIHQVRALEKIAWKIYEAVNPEGEKRGTFRRGFYMGAVVGITENLREQWQSEQEEYTGTAALVKVNDAELKEYLGQKFPNMGQSNLRRTSSQDGQSMGYREGKKMNMKVGLDNDRPGKLIALNK